jgi:MFS family permease
MTYERTIRIFYLYRFVSSFFLIGPIITLFFLEFIPYAQLGIVFATGVATAFIFEIPSGVWADWFGRKYAVAFGTILAALELFLIAYGQSFGYFLAAGIIGGFGSALVSGADTSLVYDALRAGKKEKLSRVVYGKARAIRYIAIVVAALIGAPLYTYAQTAPLYLNSVVMLAAAGIVLSIREPPIADPSKGWRAQLVLIRSGFAHVRSSPTLAWYIAFAVFSGLAVWLYHDLFRLPHFEAIGYPIVALGMIVALVSIIRSTFSWNAHRFETWFGEDRTITLLLFAPGALLVLIGLIRSPYALILVVVLYCIWSIQEVITESKLHEHILSGERATIYSIHSFVNTTMLFAGSLALSAIAGYASIFTAFVTAGTASVLIATILASARPHNERDNKP